MKPLRIVIAGTGRLGVNLFKGIQAAGHEIVGVIQNGRDNKGFMGFANRTFELFFSDTLSMRGQASKNKLPVIYIDTMSEDELAPIRELRPELIVVGGFGIIFKRPLLEIPTIGCVNTHSSLLPKHRGPNPFTAAILSDDTETGVTFHVMTEGIDTGAILGQYRIPITDTDDAGSLYKRTADLAGDRVGDVLDQIVERGLAGDAQDETQASYEKKLKPENCYIDWSLPAADIDRFVRACFPLSPFARFEHEDRIVYVTKTRVERKTVDHPPGTIIRTRPRVAISTPDGVLVIMSAAVRKPFPWIWPSPWRMPPIGSNLRQP